jgi:hypothetical protein
VGATPFSSVPTVRRYTTPLRREAVMAIKLNDRTRESMFRVLLRSIPFFPAGPELYDLVRDFRKSQTDFDEQVKTAVEGLQNTSALIATLQKGVEERMQQLQQLRLEHDRYSELTQIEAKKAEALLKQVEAALGKEQKRERWIALAMHLGVGLLYFIAGVVLGDTVKGWTASLSGKWFH